MNSIRMVLEKCWGLREQSVGRMTHDEWVKPNYQLPQWRTTDQSKWITCVSACIRSPLCSASMNGIPLLRNCGRLHESTCRHRDHDHITASFSSELSIQRNYYFICENLSLDFLFHAGCAQGLLCVHKHTDSIQLNLSSLTYIHVDRVFLLFHHTISLVLLLVATSLPHEKQTYSNYIYNSPINRKQLREIIKLVQRMWTDLDTFCATTLLLYRCWMSMEWNGE